MRKNKKIQGYKCKICGFNFSTKYKDIGKKYIEAHHLTPVSELKGDKVMLDPEKDFAVLCSNCHRMIHRSEFIGDIDLLKKRYLL